MTKLERRCYETYQLHWMKTQGISLDRFLQTINSCIDAVTDRETGEYDIFAAEERFFKTGFNGSTFVGKDEFLGSIMLNKEYMRNILSDIPDGIVEEYEVYIAEKELKDYLELSYDYRLEKMNVTDDVVTFNVYEYDPSDRELCSKYRLSVNRSGEITNDRGENVLDALSDAYDSPEMIEFISDLRAKWVA